MAPRKTRLPREANAFLRTKEGRWCRSQLVRFYRWMSQNNLQLIDLTEQHLEHFWEHELRRNIAQSAIFVYRCRQHKYLYWLYNQGFLRLVVEPPILRHMREPVPKLAAKYLRARGNKRYESVVRGFHSWLRRKKVGLVELTPAHIDSYVRRPINRELSATARKSLHARLEPYLLWLHSNGHIKFNPARPIAKPFPLPKTASDFVDSLRPVLKASTCNGYLNDLRDLYAWLAAQNLEINAFQRNDAQRWLKAMSDRGLMAVTRNGRIFRVRRYLEWLSDLGAITADPDDLLRSTDLPKIPSYLPRPFPPEADRALQKRLAKSDSIYDQALLLMRRTGVRIGELARLEYNCLENDFQGNAFLRVPLGKLHNERLVPLAPSNIDLIQRLQKQGQKSAEFLLVPSRARSTAIDHLSAALKRAAQGLDIPGPIVSHRLRHTFATELLNAGVSYAVIMKLLGHRTITMTMLYAALTQTTMVRDYYIGIEKSEATYAIADPAAQASRSDPAQSLDDAIRWVRKHLRGNGATRPRADAIIKRIHRIHEDLRHLTQQYQPN